MKRKRELRLAKLKAELSCVEAAIKGVRRLHAQASGAERDRLGEILCRLQTVREGICQSLREIERDVARHSTLCALDAF